MRAASILGFAVTLALALPAAALPQTDSIPSPAPGRLYHEALRPQFHFSARKGWINDPNGLVFYRGEYHLFFQHDPFHVTNVHMHWGHAVSTDLVHWRELPEALDPNAHGDMWSGSAVVDWRDSSGLGANGRPPQVLFYTQAGETFTVCLAYSNDGRTYTIYPGNPVLNQIKYGNRDPKVFWYEPGQEWIMCLYVGPHKARPDAIGRPVVSPEHTIQFLASTDLRHWRQLGRTGGFFECPNLVELPVDGDRSRRKWLLTDASSDYMVGQFDGYRFVPETAKIRGHSGQHIAMYAAQIFSDIPASDGRCIQMGWLTAPSPSMPFNQALTMPMELRLVSTPAGPRLTWRPVREMESLRADTTRAGPVRLAPGAPDPFAAVRGDLLEVRAEFSPGQAERVAFTVRGIPVVYDARHEQIVVNHHPAPAPLRHGRVDLAIYIDRTTLEVFASGGLTYVPVPLIADPAQLSLAVAAEGGAADFSVLEAHRLRSIWP